MTANSKPYHDAATADAFDYIERFYGVKAAIGDRVRYTGGHSPIGGTVAGARDQYLLIQLDGSKRPTVFHPTWELEVIQ